MVAPWDVAAFEFRAPSVKAVLVFLDQHTGFASHKFSLLLRGGASTPRPVLPNTCSRTGRDDDSAPDLRDPSSEATWSKIQV